MKKICIIAIILYIISAAMLIGLFYWVHLQCPNHTTLRDGIFMGIVFPTFPTYIYIDQSIINISNKVD